MKLQAKIACSIFFILLCEQSTKSSLSDPKQLRQRAIKRALFEDFQNLQKMDEAIQQELVALKKLNTQNIALLEKLAEKIRQLSTQKTNTKP